MCVCLFLCVCARARVHVCACVLDMEGSWVFASSVLIRVWIARYLTSYSNYLTSFHEALLLDIDVTPFWKKSGTITANYVSCVWWFEMCWWPHNIPTQGCFQRAKACFKSVKLKASYPYDAYHNVLFLSVVSWCSRRGFQIVSDCFMPLQSLIWIT